MQCSIRTNDEVKGHYREMQDSHISTCEARAPDFGDVVQRLGMNALMDREGDCTTPAEHEGR